MPEYRFSKILNSYLKEGIIYLKPSSQLREHASAKQLRYFRDHMITKNLHNTASGKILGGKAIKNYREKRKKEGASPLTIQRELTTAASAIKYARSELCYDVPTDLFDDRKISKADRKQCKPRIRYLSKDEEQDLIAKSPVLLADMILFCLETALRWGELRNLRWDQIKGDAIEFGYHDQKSGETSSCYITEDAQKILDRQATTSSKVFTLNGKVGVSQKWTYTQFKKAKEKAGIVDLKFHDLRKTSGLRWRNQYGLEVAQAQLRHASKTTTETHYAISTIDIIRQNVSSSDRLSNDCKVVPKEGIEPTTYALRNHVLH